MNELSVDRYTDPRLDALQAELSKQLHFGKAENYVPLAGDPIYTFDVRYLDGKVQVGIDIAIHPDHTLSTEIVVLDTGVKTYVPGYFSFYEGPEILAALASISRKHVPPKLIVVDGHGLAHPRKFGLACFVGAKTGLPTLGIAKQNLLPFARNGLSEEKYAIHEFILGGEIVGVAIRLQKGIKPVFISPGNRIALSTAVDVIKSFTRDYRLPENLRRADQASRQNVSNCDYHVRA